MNQQGKDHSACVMYEYEYEYFIVIQDQYKIIGTTLTINRIYHSNSMHTYNIID